MRKFLADLLSGKASFLAGAAAAIAIGLLLSVMGLAVNRKMHEPATLIPSVSAAPLNQPCGEAPQDYLTKARYYLAYNDRWENGDRTAALSALAWMEYYKICSERKPT